jgi:transposase
MDNAANTYTTERLDHLGIVAGICHEIELAQKIDEIAGPSERKVSCGEAVMAMVLNALGFSSRALYLMPQYLHNKPVDILISSELSAEDFNDDTLGRALDQLYTAGVTEVFAQVAAHALGVYGIEHRFYHLDSSSFHVHGEYSGREEDSQAIRITQGYSREQRPDLKQVVVSLITGQQSQLPVWMEALSGNASDKESFPKTVQAFCEQMEGEREVIFVVDSALYSAKNLGTLADTTWLTRVPATLAAAKRVLAETPAQEMMALAEGYTGTELSSSYGSVAQRWLLVHSRQAAERQEQTLQRQVRKEGETAGKAWRRLCRQTFNCAEDALAARDELVQGWKYHQVEATVHPLKRYPGPGRPATGSAPEITGYQLQGEFFLSDSTLAQARRSQGRFLLATNELDPQKLSAAAMLSQYKAQGVSVERGFRFLKDPLFFADSLFLKTPQRIMALIMIMVLALLVYALAERKLRLSLSAQDQRVPNQVGKETQTPTMRWIFQLFEGIDLLNIHQDDHLIHRQVLNLRPEHLIVIQLLGPPVANCYLSPS